VDDYKTELLQFPAGAHDDQVDATSQALNRFIARKSSAEIFSAAPRSVGQSWGKAML
jgi:phage terminase large subunit-like protein